ncbi:MAG: hypothetical protein LBP24_02475 [Coriobacteriales bacterium]|jgi:RHS repeat-associated protein|nr:hypothetical protein [Coriobacteriales bacterium]
MSLKFTADTYSERGNLVHDAAKNVTQATFSAKDGPALYGATALEHAMASQTAVQTSWSYLYDAHGNLTEATSPTGEVERFAYDAASRLVSATSPGMTTTRYDYDKLGRLLEKSYAGADEPVAYAYDSAGRRMSMEDDTGTSSYTYDEAGRLSSVTDARGRTLGYSYDEYGRMAAVAYPEGRTVAYRYDLADNLICVSDSKAGDTAYTYDAEGRVLSCTRPDGTKSAYAYDATGRLVELKNSAAGRLLSSFAYTYDATGQIATERMWQEEAEGGTAAAGAQGAGGAIDLYRTYAYDAAGQLAGFTETEGGRTSTTSYTYNLIGNRVARTTTAGSTEATISEYDAEGRLVRQDDGTGGTLSTYTYDAEGNLASKRTEGDDNKQAQETTYTYDAENRLEAVREGGALLMAATYDGDGNRVFQVHRTTVPVSEGSPALGTAPQNGPWRDASPLDVLGDIASLFVSGGAQTPDTYSYLERIYPNDFYDWAFAYGFGQGLATFACAPDMAFAPLSQHRFTSAFDEFLSVFSLEHRYDAEAEFSDEDVAALKDAGLSEADVYDIIHPHEAEGAEGKDAPEAPEAVTQLPAASREGGIIIPAETREDTRYDYELTYYVNDISYQNTQVVAEYGKRGEAKAAYTYGLGRITKTDTQGTAASYVYDGRGSVVQTYEGTGESGQGAAAQGVARGTVTQSLVYDPFGEVVSGADANALVFAYNAEERNPVTGLDYLRARYYAPDAASFITKDSALGALSSINSQNRYAFAEADPINNADPSGHAISNNAYERTMEAAGGINELYNFYVGRTLQNSYSQATAAFNARLSYAYGVDYRSLAAINSISGISQATANAYIAQGAAAALKVGATYGCAPGALTGAVITGFAANVSTAKEATNQKIASVKSNKHYQYRQYQAYLAWVAEQQRVAEQERVLAAQSGSYVAYLRRVNNVPILYSNEYVLKQYGNSQEAERLGFSYTGGLPQSNTLPSSAVNTGIQLGGRALSNYLTDDISRTLANGMSTGAQRIFPTARGSVLAAETVGGKTFGIVTENSLSTVVKALPRAAPVIGGVIDFGIQVSQGEDVDDAAIKATAHTGLSFAGAAAGAAIGAAAGSSVPIVGTIIGLVIGAGLGLVFDAVYDNYIK